MINGRQKLVLKDYSGRNNDAIFEVNWNSLAKKGKYLKITVGDKQIVLKKDHLFGILFMLGDEKDQDRLISGRTTLQRVRKHTRIIGVKTTQDIKRGEVLNIALDFTYNPEADSLVIGKGRND